MARLVDFGFPELNAMYDALPVRGKLSVMCRQFDKFVAHGGHLECCCGRPADVGGLCDSPDCYRHEATAQTSPPRKPTEP